MRAAIPALLAMISALPASAQYAEIGVSVGYSRFQDGEFYSVSSGSGFREAYSYGNGLRVGARMSFDLKSYFAHEVAYSWQRAPFRVEALQNGASSLSEATSNIHHYYYNLVKST